MHRCLFFLLVGTILTVLLGSLAHHSRPQRPESSPQLNLSVAGVGTTISRREFQDEKDLPNVFVLAPREVEQLLSRANEATEEQRYVEAVSLLAEVLMNDQEDYFTQDSNQSGTARSIKRTALEIIGAFPSKGREAWELRFGATAKSELEEAVAARDFREIAAVAQRYLHTQAGYEAMILLGRQQLYQGRFVQAARSFDQIYPYSDRRDDLHLESAILSATAWLLAGESSLAEPAIEMLVNNHAGVRIPWNQSSFVIGRDLETVKRQLESNLQSFSPLESSSVLEQWVVHRGSKSRNVNAEGGLPLIKPLWRVPVVNSTDDEEIVERLASAFLETNSNAIPTMHPLFVANFVIMRTPSHVMGIDMETGKRTWDYPWDDISVSGMTDDETTAMLIDSSRQHQLKQRIWEDQIYGRMSSDGKQLYFIDGLGYAARNKYATMPGVPGQAQVKAFSARDINHLVALQLIDQSGQSVEGKLAWRVGDTDGMDQPDLEGIFFLGPPLPIQDKLFVIGEYQSEVKLLALSPKTGEVLWSQQLAAVHEIGAVQNDGLRRLAGAVPSYGEGILVCPTAAGAIVAVDPWTQSLLWGFQFPFRENERFRATRAFLEDSRAPGNKWADEIAAIVDGKVILTPIESESVYCLDLYTGELIWENPIKRNNKLFVGGVHNDMLFTVGEDEVEAFDLNTAKPIWQCSIREYGGPSGQGFMDDSSYYLPTLSSNLIRINLQTGDIISGVASDKPLGNLISLQGRIISYNYDSVDAYYQDSAAEKQAIELLAQNPLDPAGLSLRGQLELQRGNWQDAIGTFETAFTERQSETHRELLVTALIRGLRTNFEEASPSADKHRELLMASNKRAEFLRLQVEGLVSTERYLDAFEQLIELTMDDNPEIESMERKRVVLEDRVVVQDRWYQSVLTQLFNQASSDETAEMTQGLKQFEAQVLSENNLRKLNLFDDLVRSSFPNPLRLIRCAELSLENGETLRALRYYQEVLESENEELVPAARVGLARVFLKSRQIDSLMSQLAFLADLPQETSLPSGLTVGEAIQQLQQNPLIKDSVAPPRDWLYGRMEVDEGGDVIGSRMVTQFFPVIPSAIEDVSSEDYQLDHDQQQNGILRDRYGNELLSFPLRNPTGVTEYYGSTFQTTRFLQSHGLLIVVSGYDVIAVDLTQISNEDNAVLWRASLLPETLPDPSRAISRHRVNRRGHNGPLGWNVYFAVDTNFRRLGATSPINRQGFCFLKQNQLVCVDPLTGEVNWRRSDIAVGSDCIGNDDTVVVMDPSYDKARLFRLEDGSEIKQYELDVARNVLTTFDSQALSYESKVDHIRLRLDDLATEKLVWDKEYPQNSRATLIAPDEFAVLTPDGHFEIRRLSNGEAVVDTQLAADDQVKSILVTRDEDHYILAASHNSAGTGGSQKLDDEAETTVTTGNQVLTLVKGNLWAISRETGKTAWPGPVYVDQFGFSERITYSSPILMLLRHHQSRSARGATSSRFSSEIALIDKRDGRLISHLDNIPQLTYKMHIKTKPIEQEAVIELNTKEITISLSDQPLPPAPPVDLRRYRPSIEP